MQQREQAGDELRFVSENHIDEIKLLIASAERWDAAVAYWGSGAVKSLGLRKARKGATIVCNLFSSGCNPHEIKRLYELKRFKLRYHNGLHAKVYWTDRAVCAGSSNASGAGLDFDQRKAPQREANILSCAPKLIAAAREWLDEIIEESHPITEPLIKEAVRRYRQPVSDGVVPELIDFSHDQLRDAKVAVLVWAVETTPEEDQQVETIKNQPTYRDIYRFSTSASLTGQQQAWRGETGPTLRASQSESRARPGVNVRRTTLLPFCYQTR